MNHRLIFQKTVFYLKIKYNRMFFLLLNLIIMDNTLYITIFYKVYNLMLN